MRPDVVHVQQLIFIVGTLLMVVTVVLVLIMISQVPALMRRERHPTWPPWPCGPARPGVSVLAWSCCRRLTRALFLALSHLSA